MKVIQFTIPVAKDHSIHVQEDVLPHFYEHLHRHYETQITHVIQGEGTLITGTVMQPFKPGDIFIIGANQPHLFKSDPAYFQKDSDKTTVSHNIFYNPNGFIASLLNYPEMGGIKKFLEFSIHGLKISDTHSPAIATYITSVLAATKGYRISSFIELLQKVADLNDLQYLSTELFEYTITDTEGLRMNDIYQYTIANYTENITLEQIAEVVFLTPQSFCRYFKKHTLKTYTEFLNEVRINEACKKFMNRDFESISAIAYQSGFNNVVTFNRVFKSTTGKSPRDFIREYRTKVEMV